MRKKNSGISPVVGVLLVVALVVSLAVLTGSLAFDIASDFVSQSPDAAVDIQEVNSDLMFEVIRNENVDYFIVKAPSGSFHTNKRKQIGSDNGNTGELGSVEYIAVNIDDNKGLYTVIAVMPDGSRQVIDSYNVD